MVKLKEITIVIQTIISEIDETKEKVKISFFYFTREEKYLSVCEQAWAELWSIYAYIFLKKTKMLEVSRRKWSFSE